MIQYYEYETETSPRKLETEYNPVKKNKDQNKKRNQINKLSIKNERILENRKNVKHICEIAVGFIVLLTISYRYAIINSNFTEKENLKTKLFAIQKQNDQLQVSIEQGMNINNIEQAAKEKLGMQKLENNQKIYVSLNKKDYIESSADAVVKESNKSLWKKIVGILKGE